MTDREKAAAAVYRRFVTAKRRNPARWTCVVIALAVAACGPVPPTSQRYKVDVANTGGPIVVNINTDRAGWGWIVPPNSQMVLLDEPAQLRGAIELLDPRGCVIYDTVELPATSFTMIIEPVAKPPGFRLRLESGALLIGPPNIDYSAICSG